VHLRDTWLAKLHAVLFSVMHEPLHDRSHAFLVQLVAVQTDLTTRDVQIIDIRTGDVSLR
jgi:hypothetical protein